LQIAGILDGQVWNERGVIFCTEGSVALATESNQSNKMRILRTAVRCVCVAAVGFVARGQTQIDLRTQGRNIDFSTAASTRSSKTGTALPVACSIGETFLKTDAPAGKNFYVCTASGVWTVQGVDVPSPTGKVGQVLSNDGNGPIWQGLGGDLSGPASSVIVTGFNGRKLSGITPLDGQYLKWNGALQQWEATTLAGALSVFGRTGAVAAQTGDYSFSQIGGTISGSQLPAATGDLTGSFPGPTVVKFQGRPVSPNTPLNGQVLAWDGSQWIPQSPGMSVSSIFGRTGIVTGQNGDYSFGQITGTVSAGQLPAAGGDLSGTLANATVTQIQGRSVASSVPSSGQFLGWNGTQWAPQTPTAGGVSSVFGRSGAVTAQTGDYAFGQIAGSVATGQLPAAGGDLSGTLGNATVGRLQGRAVASTLPGAGQVLTWDGAQWTPQTVTGGSGGVSGLDKTVSNTYLAGAKQTFVASVATSGINVAPGTLPTNPAAGDMAIDSSDANKLKVYDGAQWNTLISLSNYTTTFTSATVVTVNGTTHRLGTANLLVDCYDNGTPSSQVEPDKVTIDPVLYNVSIYFASAQTGHCVITGSSGVATGAGGGIGMASQLGDLGLVQTSAAVLTAGLNCSNATPCNVRLGNTVYSVTNSSTITISAGTGAVYVYVDAAGMLTAGHNLTVTCAGGCAAVSGITSFPAGSLPLYTWTASNGMWDTGGGTDRRAFLSTRNLSGGAGIVALDTGSQSIVAVDAATVPTYLASSAVLDFTVIAPGGCGEGSLPVPGASPGDSVAPGWPAGMEAGLIGTMRVSASGVVAVRVCNLSGAAVDPAAATFRATIVRSF
jgi:hypothetical protein